MFYPCTTIWDWLVSASLSWEVVWLGMGRDDIGRIDCYFRQCKHNRRSLHVRSRRCNYKRNLIDQVIWCPMRVSFVDMKCKKTKNRFEASVDAVFNHAVNWSRSKSLISADFLFVNMQRLTAVKWAYISFIGILLWYIDRVMVICTHDCDKIWTVLNNRFMLWTIWL